MLAAKLCRNEFELVFLDKMDSGSWKLLGHWSSSLAGIGSGDAWIDELVVRIAVSGVMMGDPCRELDEPEEPLRLEGPAVRADCI